MLELKSLTAGYSEPVVRGVSFTLREGEFAALLGRNGSGKTTLLRAITGSARSFGGEALVFGEDCAAMSARARARRVALLSQSLPAPPGLTVRELVEMGRYAHDGLLRRSAASPAAVIDAARLYGIENLLGRDCASLSQGQLQLAHLARIEAQGAPVMLLDEPSSALDCVNAHNLFEKLSRSLAHGSRCALAVLHDPALALRWCPRCLLMEGGQLLADLRPGELSAPELERALRLLYPRLRVKEDKDGARRFCYIE